MPLSNFSGSEFCRIHQLLPSWLFLSVPFWSYGFSLLPLSIVHHMSNPNQSGIRKRMPKIQILGRGRGEVQIRIISECFPILAPPRREVELKSLTWAKEGCILKAGWVPRTQGSRVPLSQRNHLNFLLSLFLNFSSLMAWVGLQESPSGSLASFHPSCNWDQNPDFCSRLQPAKMTVRSNFFLQKMKALRLATTNCNSKQRRFFCSPFANSVSSRHSLMPPIKLLFIKHILPPVLFLSSRWGSSSVVRN